MFKDVDVKQITKSPNLFQRALLLFRPYHVITTFDTDGYYKMVVKELFGVVYIQEFNKSDIKSNLIDILHSIGHNHI